MSISSMDVQEYSRGGKMLERSYVYTENIKPVIICDKLSEHSITVRYGYQSKVLSGNG